MSRALPVYGGVRDGDIVSIPSSAEPDFVIKLEQMTKPFKGEEPKCTEYIYRTDGGPRHPQALVARGMKWPFQQIEGTKE